MPHCSVTHASATTERQQEKDEEREQEEKEEKKAAAMFVEVAGVKGEHRREQRNNSFGGISISKKTRRQVHV